MRVLQWIASGAPDTVQRTRSILIVVFERQEKFGRKRGAIDTEISFDPATSTLWRCEDYEGGTDWQVAFPRA